MRNLRPTGEWGANIRVALRYLAMLSMTSLSAWEREQAFLYSTVHMHDSIINRSPNVTSYKSDNIIPFSSYAVPLTYFISVNPAISFLCMFLPLMSPCNDFLGMRAAVHYTENQIFVFPEMKLPGFVPNSFFHVSVFIYSQDWSAYLATAKQAERSCEYINRSQIHECGNQKTEHCNSVLEKPWLHSFISGKT